MSIKKLGIAIFLSAIVGVGQVAYAQGIPVYDNASFLKQVEQYANAVKQLEMLKSQLNTMNSTLDAMKGARGMGNILTPEQRNYLPGDWKTWSGITNATADTASQYQSMQTSVAAIKQGNRLLTANEISRMGPQMKALYERMQNNAAVQSAIGQAAYKNASDRTQRMQVFVDKVDQTTDIKAINDLQGRIQAEQAMIANEQIKLNEAMRLTQAEQKLIEQQKFEMGMKMHGPIQGAKFTKP